MTLRLAMLPVLILALPGCVVTTVGSAVTGVAGAAVSVAGKAAKAPLTVAGKVVAGTPAGPPPHRA